MIHSLQLAALMHQEEPDFLLALAMLLHAQTPKWKNKSVISTVITIQAMFHPDLIAH